jgi:hypothetical protein
VFRHHPDESLTAASVAAFEDSISAMSTAGCRRPRNCAFICGKKGQLTRYRLTSVVTKMTVEETAAFIDAQVRAETRLVVIVVSFMMLATLVGVLTRFD